MKERQTWILAERLAAMRALIKHPLDPRKAQRMVPWMTRWIALGVCMACAFTSVVWACGPFPLVPFFWDPRGQDLPLDRLVAGELLPFEVLRPREALVVYRLLQDLPLDGRDRQKILATGGEEVIHTRRSGLDRWHAARRALGEYDPISSYQTFRRGGKYSWYGNCLDDAFAAATRALESRIERWGNDSPEIRTWVAGQDQVFANCNGGVTIPEPLGDTWHEDLRSDRAYQIAAAYFYAEAWPEAERAFLAIAAEPLSVWSPLSAYVAARAMIRQRRFPAAIEQLRTVLADQRITHLRPAAEGLLRFARYQHEPRVQHAETRALLLGPGLPEDFARVWTDYVWGLGRVPDLEQKLDLWMILVTRNGDSPDFAGRHELQQRIRQAPNHRLWHFAALLRGDAALPAADQALNGVAAIARNAPERKVAVFQQVRLLIEMGRVDEARQAIEELRTQAASWPPAVRNRLQALEALVADDLSGFVEAAHGVVVAAAWDGHHGRANVNLAEHGIDPRAPALLAMAGPVLQQLSIDSMGELLADADLPAPTHEAVLRAAYARALILGDHQQAQRLAPQVAERLPDLAAGAQTYLQADEEEGAFVSAMVLLWSPGARPFIPSGAKHPWDRGWWCSGMEPEPLDAPRARLVAERSVSATEQRALGELAPAPEHLARAVLPWAEAHPDDPRVPEALHRIVVLTRRTCAWLTFGEISRRAFDLLHRRYPDSPWTEKTPYWFGD